MTRQPEDLQSIVARVGDTRAITTHYRNAGARLDVRPAFVVDALGVLRDNAGTIISIPTVGTEGTK
jgi:hypothetical protein